MARDVPWVWVSISKLDVYLPHMTVFAIALLGLTFAHSFLVTEQLYIQIVVPDFVPNLCPRFFNEALQLLLDSILMLITPLQPNQGSTHT
jgi:hypothetical protein